MKQIDPKFNLPPLLEVVRAIVIIIFTIVIAYKLLVTPISLSMDFYALLSLLLALFSVALSALFYFKATDTSNAFYDNTYKFTKDIAELLVRIESGFGERLRHLDEGYTRIQDRFYPQSSKEEIAEAQKQVKEEEENLQAKLAERDKLIEELVQKSQLEGKEKQKFLGQLRSREEELQNLQHELTLLKAEANKLQKQDDVAKKSNLLDDHSFQRYVVENVIRRIPERIWEKGSPNIIRASWKKLVPELFDPFLDDLRENGLTNSGGELTSRGVSFMVRMAQSRNLKKDVG